MSFKVDLHLHSNFSDGSSTPFELIDEAASKQLTAIAITDHDVFTVTKDLQTYAKQKGIELIAGIELSCMDVDTGRKVHMLAYGFNEDHPHIDALLKPFIQHVTYQRLNTLKPLTEMGFPITKEDLNYREPLFKQDIALAMVKKGYGTFTDLFNTYFRGPKSVEKIYPITFMNVKEAIEAIHQDGGIAVLAHPRRYNTFNEIPKYIKWGLDGIEISHPSYQEGDLDIVLAYPLLHFGGSDYHGKLNISNLRVMGHYGITLENYQQIKEVLNP